MILSKYKNTIVCLFIFLLSFIFLLLIEKRKEQMENVPQSDAESKEKIGAESKEKIGAESKEKIGAESEEKIGAESEETVIIPSFFTTSINGENFNMQKGVEFFLCVYCCVIILILCCWSSCISLIIKIIAILFHGIMEKQ